jgi:hypothetical protein
VLLARLLFTVTAFSSHLELVSLELARKLASNWLPNITRVAFCSLRADRTENSASVVGTCLPNHCTAKVAALTAANALVRCLLLSNEQ